MHPIHQLWKGLTTENATFCVLVVNEANKSTQPKSRETK